MPAAPIQSTLPAAVAMSVTEAASPMCPLCRKRPLVASADITWIRGLVLAYRVSEKRVVGCTWCVRGEFLKETLLSALIGWFSPRALIVNPFLVLGNLATCLAGVRANLKKGIEPASTLKTLKWLFILFVGLSVIAVMGFYVYLENI